MFPGILTQADDDPLLLKVKCLKKKKNFQIRSITSLFADRACHFKPSEVCGLVSSLPCLPAAGITMTLLGSAESFRQFARSSLTLFLDIFNSLHSGLPLTQKGHVWSLPGMLAMDSAGMHSAQSTLRSLLHCRDRLWITWHAECISL